MAISLMALIGSAGLSAFATPLFARLARSTGLVVKPREDRWHRSPTPLLGGAGIALGVLVAMVLALPLTQASIVVALCAAAAFALGLLDDFRNLAPASKLVGQVLIASVLATGGVRVEITPFAPLAYVLTVLWVVGIMNAVNLMDNMDGLAAGVTPIAGAGLSGSALAANPTPPRPSGHPRVAAP